VTAISQRVGTGQLGSAVVAAIAVAYFIWIPMDVPVRSTGEVGAIVAVTVAAIALGAFSTYIVLARAVSTRYWLILLLATWIVFSQVATIVFHGGVFGPAEYTGNFVFRTMTVLSALVAGYRLAAVGRITPATSSLVGAWIVLSVAFMMLLAVASGTYVDAYRGQGVEVIGTASGEAVQAYLLAYAAPLLFFVRSSFLRIGLFAVALGCVALTYRRGPLLCALVPMVLMPFLDRRSESGRTWILDLVAVTGLAIAFGVAVGIEQLSARWLGMFEGEAWALSERDLVYPILLSQLFPIDVETMFGHGIGASVSILGEALGREIFAHNDWLELLISVGIVGTLPFLLLHVVLVAGVLGVWWRDRYVGLIACALYAQFFLSNMIEGVIYAAQHGALLMFFLGASIGWSRLRK